MRGVSKRPDHPGLVARIVKNVRDSTLDVFIPIEEAEAMANAGKLHKIEMGRDYPNSYVNS